MTNLYQARFQNALYSLLHFSKLNVFVKRKSRFWTIFSDEHDPLNKNIKLVFNQKKTIQMPAFESLIPCVDLFLCLDKMDRIEIRR
jgi:hypothetical protein